MRTVSCLAILFARVVLLTLSIDIASVYEVHANVRNVNRMRIGQVVWPSERQGMLGV